MGNKLWAGVLDKAKECGWEERHLGSMMDPSSAQGKAEQRDRKHLGPWNRVVTLVLCHLPLDSSMRNRNLCHSISFFFSFWMSKKDSHGRTWKRSWQVVFCKNYTWISKWFWEGCTEINLLFNSIFRKLLGVCWLSLWGGGIYSLVWTGSSPLLNSLNFSRRGLELVSVACWEPQLLDVASRACGGPTWVSAGNQESWLHRPCLSWGGSAVIL